MGFNRTQAGGLSQACASVGSCLLLYCGPVGPFHRLAQSSSTWLGEAHYSSLLVHLTWVWAQMAQTWSDDRQHGCQLLAADSVPG